VSTAAFPDDASVWVLTERIRSAILLDQRMVRVHLRKVFYVSCDTACSISDQKHPSYTSLTTALYSQEASMSPVIRSSRVKVLIKDFQWCEKRPERQGLQMEYNKGMGLGTDCALHTLVGS